MQYLVHHGLIAIIRGSASRREDDFVSIWKECSDDLKDCLGSVVVPIGSLSSGLCSHRALLFKVRRPFIFLCSDFYFCFQQLTSILLASFAGVAVF